jgi:hypothetical protein
VRCSAGSIRFSEVQGLISTHNEAAGLIVRKLVIATVAAISVCGSALAQSWDADAGVIALARAHGLMERWQVEQMLRMPMTRFGCLPEGSICEQFTYPDGSNVSVQFKDRAFGFVDENGPPGSR